MTWQTQSCLIMKEVTEWNVVCTLKVTTSRKADRGSLHKRNFRVVVYYTTEHLFISMLEKIFCVFPLVWKLRTYFSTIYFFNYFNSARHDWVFSMSTKLLVGKNFPIFKNGRGIRTVEAHSCEPSCKKRIPQMTEDIICHWIKTR